MNQGETASVTAQMPGAQAPEATAMRDDSRLKPLVPHHIIGPMFSSGRLCRHNILFDIYFEKRAPRPGGNNISKLHLLLPCVSGTPTVQDGLIYM